MKIYKYLVVSELAALPKLNQTEAYSLLNKRIEKMVRNWYKIVLFKNKSEENNMYFCTKCQSWHVLSKKEAIKYKRGDKLTCKGCNSKLEVIYPNNRIEKFRAYFVSFENNCRNELIARYFYYEKEYLKSTGECSDYILEVERVNLNRVIAVVNHTSVNMQKYIFHPYHDSGWKRDRYSEYWKYYPCNKENVVQTASQLKKMVKNNEVYKYSCIDIALKKEFDLIDHIEMYQTYPKVELFFKLNKLKMIGEMLSARYTYRWDILETLTKSDIKFIQKHNPSYNQLKAYKVVKIDDIELIEKAAIAKFFNFREKYKTKPKTIEYVYQKVVEEEMTSCVDYGDYLSWCEDLGMDIKDKRVLYPMDFKKAHDEAQIQYTLLKEKICDRRIREYAKELEKYAFKEKEFVIKPIQTQKELITESAKLKHCVRTYAEEIAHRRTSIFAIRENKNPNEPFVTLELKKDVVIQCRAFKNREPADNVKHFVNDWCKKFNYRSCFSNV